MFSRRARTDAEIATERLILRPPHIRDYEGWAKLRRESREFLVPWEPEWSRDHLSIRAFRNRVAWAERSISPSSESSCFIASRSFRASGESAVPLRLCRA